MVPVWKTLVGLRTLRALQATEICRPQKHLSNDEILICVFRKGVRRGHYFTEPRVCHNGYRHWTWLKVAYSIISLTFYTRAVFSFTRSNPPSLRFLLTLLLPLFSCLPRRGFTCFARENSQNSCRKCGRQTDVGMELKVKVMSNWKQALKISIVYLRPQRFSVELDQEPDLIADNVSGIIN